MMLVVTAVQAERDAVLRRLGSGRPGSGLPYGAVEAGAVVAAAGGVGPVAAAVATSRLLDALVTAGRPVDLVVSAGIAGGFAGRVGIGDVVVAQTAHFADLGAATDGGFLDLAGLGLAGGEPLTSPRSDQVCAALAAGGLQPRAGGVLTLATMTGTDARAAALADAHRRALAEAMEGYGVAWAAVQHGLPWAEVRAISNLIGRRDRSRWDIPAAFAALSAAIAALAADATRPGSGAGSGSGSGGRAGEAGSTTGRQPGAWADADGRAGAAAPGDGGSGGVGRGAGPAGEAGSGR
jgi:futalosine hydrolase